MNKLVPIVGGSTLVYACLACMMGVLPGIELSKVPAGPGVEPLTALQSEGREVYVANGCSYCHTQQVRPLNQDKVFGRPSAAGDFAYQTPELLGSERTGPDLTNIGVRQPSSVWQYIHLYNPRAVVPESIMPSFNWLFDVVDQAASGVTPIPLPKAYASARSVVVPTHKAEALIAYLASLRQPPWAGTEAVSGGRPIQVVLRGLHDAKVGGLVYGSAMPPFAATLSDAEVADIVDYERSSWGNHGKPVIAAQVAAERAKAQ